MSDSDNEILSLIDQGSYASAQALLSRKIKNFPHRSFYYALSNRILYKQGKTAQALKNNLELLSKVPNDPQTVSILYDFFTEFGDPAQNYTAQAFQAYENVIKKYPGSQSTTALILEWFSRSLSSYDPKLLNRIVTNLYKNSKSSPSHRLYTTWSAFIYLQLIPASPDKEKHLYTALALKLLEPLNPLSSQEQYVLYRLLQHKHDYTSIVDHVADNTSDLTLDVQIIYLDALAKSGSWDTLYTFTSLLLLDKKFNDFDTWKYYIQACAHRGGENVYQDVLDAIATVPATRNTALARVEAALVLNKDRYHAAILDYFKSYGHKLCCYSDIRAYIDVDACPPLKAHLPEVLSALLAEYQNQFSHNNLIKLVNVQKLTLYFERDSRLTKEFVDHFTAQNWTIHELTPSDSAGESNNNPANELALLSLLLSLHLDASTANVVRSIVVLTSLLKHDKTNHNLKLWLAKLHANIATSNSIPPLYDSLKVRMTQHETLVHYLSPANPSKKHLDDFVNVYRFYLTSDDEIKQSLQDAFDSGVFSVLSSFISFGQRLAHSTSRYLVICTIVKYSLILSDNGYLNYFANLLSSECDKLAEMDTLSDNRDFSTEWKSVGFSDANDLVPGASPGALDSLNTPISWFSSAHIKLAVLKYVLVLSDSFDSPAASRHLKALNKVLSSATYTPATKFDSLINKLTLNFLKLFKQKSSEVDAQSMINFCLKNLKFDKIKAVLIPGDSKLSWHLSHNLLSLAEFISIARLLFRQSRSTTPLKQAVDSLVKDVKAQNFADAQRTELQNIQTNAQWPLSLDASVSESIFKDLADSTQESLAYLSKV